MGTKRILCTGRGKKKVQERGGDRRRLMGEGQGGRKNARQARGKEKGVLKVSEGIRLEGLATQIKSTSLISNQEKCV